MQPSSSSLPMTSLPPLEKMGNGKPAENWIESRRIYLSTLNDILTPIVYETMHNIHQDAMEFSEIKTNEAIEKLFMDYLAEVRVWSINIVNGETQAILAHCPWFPTLLKGVFVSSVMVLSSAQLNRANAPASKVRLNIPTAPTFVQTMYSNVASRFFNNPNLFRSTGLTDDKMITNKNQSYKEIEAAIDWTVRSLIPLQQVIESSMNFQGNNPIITAKPNNASILPRPRNTMAPIQSQSAASQQAQRGNTMNIGSQEKETQDPKMSNRSRVAMPTLDTATHVANVANVVNVANVATDPLVPVTITEKKKTSSVALVGKEVRKEIEKRKETLRPSRISFAPPPPPPSLYNMEKKQSSRKSGALRPSNFSKRTDSDAINKVVAQLKLDIPSSSSTSSSSSSSSSSSRSMHKARGRVSKQNYDLDSIEIDDDASINSE